MAKNIGEWMDEKIVSSNWQIGCHLYYERPARDPLTRFIKARQRNNTLDN